MSDFTIQQVANRTGLTAYTLRYYERIGLLDPPARATGNQRCYDADDLAWLAFVRRLRATGMPIRTMQRFADLRRAGDRQHHPCAPGVARGTSR